MAARPQKKPKTSQPSITGFFGVSSVASAKAEVKEPSESSEFVVSLTPGARVTSPALTASDLSSSRRRPTVHSPLKQATLLPPSACMPQSSSQPPINRMHPGTKKPDFTYTPDFLTPAEQLDLISHLSEIPWQRVCYEKMGIKRTTPRLTFCYGMLDESKEPVVWKDCAYSPEPIPSWLEVLQKKVQVACGETFNAAILNKYGNTEEHINWHKDDEKFLRHTIVASVSLGSVRLFKIRGHDNIEREASLGSGSLAVLYHGIAHSLPKHKPRTAADNMVRYNITLRCLKQVYADPSHEYGSGMGNYYHYNRGARYALRDK